MEFTLEQLKQATDKYIELRQEGYSHHAAIHHGSIYFRDHGEGMGLIDATALMREGFEDV